MLRDRAFGRGGVTFVGDNGGQDATAEATGEFMLLRGERSPALSPVLRTAAGGGALREELLLLKLEPPTRK